MTGLSYQLSDQNGRIHYISSRPYDMFSAMSVTSELDFIG